MLALRIAYAANILILVPIAIPTLLRLGDVAQGRFDESAGWRTLVGALWTAILVLSLLGLRAPLVYCPVLLLLAVSFAAIVLVWPWLIPWRHLLAD